MRKSGALEGGGHASRPPSRAPLLLSFPLVLIFKRLLRRLCLRAQAMFASQNVTDIFKNILLPPQIFRARENGETNQQLKKLCSAVSKALTHNRSLRLCTRTLTTKKRDNAGVCENCPRQKCSRRAKKG